MTEGGVSIFDITRLHKSALQSWLKEKTEIEICRLESAHNLFGNCFGWYSFLRGCQFFCDGSLDGRLWRLFFSILFHYHSQHSCKWYSEDDTENTPERCSSKHDDKYKKWRQIERFAHYLRDEEIILDSLYDKIECYYDSCRFPSES